MGLIAKNHPNELTPELSQEILNTFSIVIINEYDLENNVKYPEDEIKPHRYMATRYLQLQHPSRNGRTSGDGRGIWNGEFNHGGVTWDVTSSGTGATSLSPATAIEGKYFKTGDRRVAYGNGYGSVDDGLSAALMSEVFHKNGIPTERTLAIIEFERGNAINVRASKCLLRPSHFFSHLKQGNYESLKAAIDFYIDRQISNGEWPKIRDANDRYKFMARQIAFDFAKASARFESDYVFVWMDWDGDNILCNGGIIDYGSVRQFGLYHHEYRYDDVDRWSTKIPEQRLKARYVVQAFAQITDFLISGKKRNITEFRKDPVLRLFDKRFAQCLNENLLTRMGFSPSQKDHLLSKHQRLLSKFKSHFSYFEKASSTKGIYETADGVTCDAIFCMRDILRELPKHLLNSDAIKLMSSEEFIQHSKSSYAKKKDLVLSENRRRRIQDFQSLYFALIKKISRDLKVPVRKVLLEVNMRSSVLNAFDRITGDGVISLTDQLLKDKKRLSKNELYQLFIGVVQTQLIHQKMKGRESDRPSKPSSKRLEKAIESNLLIIKEYRDSI